MYSRISPLMINLSDSFVIETSTLAALHGHNLYHHRNHLTIRVISFIVDIFLVLLYLSLLSHRLFDIYLNPGHHHCLHYVSTFIAALTPLGVYCVCGHRTLHTFHGLCGHLTSQFYFQHLFVMLYRPCLSSSCSFFP